MRSHKERLLARQQEMKERVARWRTARNKKIYLALHRNPDLKYADVVQNLRYFCPFHGTKRILYRGESRITWYCYLCQRMDRFMRKKFRSVSNEDIKWNCVY